jgi:hypothetical protein
VPLPQTVPHLPQFFASLFMLVQALLQAVWPVGQVQAPLTQVAPVAQVVPQVPQLVVLDRMSLHVPPQSPCPVGQMQALCQQL